MSFEILTPTNTEGKELEKIKVNSFSETNWKSQFVKKN
jgi:hypothetical protein